MWLRIHGSLGDEIALTGLPREIHRTYPAEPVYVTARFRDLFVGNPHCINTPPPAGSIPIDLPLAEDWTLGHFAYAYGKRIGVRVFDPTPEIFLTAGECAGGETPHGENLIAIDPWAGWPRRRWPVQLWQDLARQLRAVGWRVVEVGRSWTDHFGVVRSGAILGDAVDASLVDQTTVRQIAAYLRQCRMLVAADSGLVHLAAAVGTPQVTLYSIPWYATACRTTLPLFDVYSRCGTCTQRCAKTAEGTCAGLLAITPDDVRVAVEIVAGWAR